MHNRIFILVGIAALLFGCQENATSINGDLSSSINNYLSSDVNIDLSSSSLGFSSVELASSSLGSYSSSNMVVVPGLSSQAAPSSSSAAPIACNEASAIWTTNDIYGKYELGESYVARNNVWGGDRAGYVAGESMWVVSERCWGANASHQEATGLVKSFPNMLRGWATWDGYIRQNTGVPLKLSEMTKAKIYWKTSAPSAPGGRYQGLWDIYLHTITNPSATQLSHTNIQIFQQIYDPSGYASGEAAKGVTKTYGGITFKMNIINGATMSSTNKVITLFMGPFAKPNMGVPEALIDLKAVLDGLKADGILDPNLYLSSIQPGWEIIGAGKFVTLDFWTALQDEPEL